MLKLTLARANLYLGRKSLDCVEHHLNKRKEYFERAKALDGYTPALRLIDRYHAIWCYLCLWISDGIAKINDKLIPSREE